MEKIVIFRPGALGDTLLAFPVLAALRHAYPDARLYAIGNEPVLRLAYEAKLADEIFAFDLPCWAELLTEEGIRSPEAHQVLSRAYLVAWWMRDPDGLVERNLEALGVACVMRAPGSPPEPVRMYCAEYLMRSLAPFVDERDRPAGEALRLKPSAEARFWAVKEWAWRGLVDVPVLALHPGSGGQAKCWPPERFAALANPFIDEGWKVLVIEGPADAEAAAQVLRALHGRAQHISGLSLSQLAALLARAALYVGNDSGVTHLSALVGTPTLALFGPTDPVIWGPRQPHAQAIWAGEAGRGPWMPRPMTALDVETVYAAAQRLLQAG